MSPNQAMRLAVPPGFHYRSTVNSHGWSALAPFSFDDATLSLSTILRLRGGDVVRLGVSPADGDGLNVAVDGVSGALSPDAASEIGAVVARVLGFDQDVAAFYSLAASLPDYRWIEQASAGRMLVSPTVWEDLAKTLLTTNTTWAMTKLMAARLTTLGEPFAGGGHAFPTPERVAALGADSLNAHVRAGYRGAYLHALALDIAEGRFEPDSLLDRAHSDDEVYRRLKSLKGFGDYAAGAMSRLLGRFDALGLDSVCRTMYRQMHNGGAPATDAEIAAHYAPFGPWRGLAVWMDVMKDDLLARPS